MEKWKVPLLNTLASDAFLAFKLLSEMGNSTFGSLETQPTYSNQNIKQ